MSSYWIIFIKPALKRFKSVLNFGIFTYLFMLYLKSKQIVEHNKAIIYIGKPNPQDHYTWRAINSIYMH